MYLVSMSIEQFIILIVLLLIIALSIYLFLSNQKKKKLFITQVIHKLINEKMENVKYLKKNIYDISFRYNNRNFFIKLYKGGNKKGFVMTNPFTIHEQKYKSEYGSSVKSEHLENLTAFLLEKFDGIKIILIKDNLLRITKYINENEIEEVRYNEPAFGIYIVQEKDLDSFIDLIKKKRK